MKTASVADLRNDFRRVAAWLAQGEEVEILRRGRPFTRLLPLESKARAKEVPVDFAAQLQANWGDRVFSAREFQQMRDFDRNGDEG